MIPVYISCTCGAALGAFFDTATTCDACGQVWHLELCKALPAKRTFPRNKRRTPRDK